MKILVDMPDAIMDMVEAERRDENPLNLDREQYMIDLVLKGMWLIGPNTSGKLKKQAATQRKPESDVMDRAQAMRSKQIIGLRLSGLTPAGEDFSDIRMHYGY